MRVLAIETVGTTGSVAALARDRVLAERALDPDRRSAQSLAPAIAKLLADIGWRPADVELVAVATGPGSFTGLRIGVTTAKTFAYAIGCQVMGVPTLLAIAWQAAHDAPRLSVVLDAQRGELFVAEFARGPEGHWQPGGATRVVARQAWLAALVPGDVVTGPGLAPLVERLPAGVVAVDRALWAPTAAAVGQVGWRHYALGERTTAFDLAPQYFRRAAAEEKG